MMRTLSDWLWRGAVLLALAWIGLQLHQIHEDMLQPADDTTTADAAPDDLQDSVDGLRDDVDRLNQKVDALLVATAQLKK